MHGSGSARRCNSSGRLDIFTHVSFIAALAMVVIGIVLAPVTNEVRIIASRPYASEVLRSVSGTSQAIPRVYGRVQGLRRSRVHRPQTRRTVISNFVSPRDEDNCNTRLQ